MKYISTLAILLGSLALYSHDTKWVLYKKNYMDRWEKVSSHDGFGDCENAIENSIFTMTDARCIKE